jgi:hypothetical protein
MYGLDILCLRRFEEFNFCVKGIRIMNLQGENLDSIMRLC